jgi:ribose transport system substrate-binding protein
MNHPLNAHTVLLFEAKAKELGLEFTVTDAERKSDKQIDDIQALIQKNVDALIVLPTDSFAVAPGVEAAADAGIPVFSVLRNVPAVGEKLITYCGVDDFSVGKLGGIYVSLMVNGRGNVVHLTGTPGVTTSEDKSRGFHSVIDNFPDIKIVAEQTAKYQRAEAMTVMEGILQANKSIDVLFAANDEMAGGAIQAIQAANRTGIKVIGANLQKDAYQRLLTGEQAADITTPTKRVIEALEAALDYLNGKPVPRVKFIAVDIVTKENCKAFEDQVY